MDSEIKKIAVVAASSEFAQATAKQFELKVTAGGFELTDPSISDLIVCVGGDGWFVHTVHSSNYPDTLFTGINTGSLGFYYEFVAADMDKILSILTKKHFNTQKLMLLEVSDAKGSSYLSLNDVVIERDSGQAMKASMTIGKGEFPSFVGDGLIFSPPQGSTGYAVAAYGAVLSEGVSAIQITPISPHVSVNYRFIKSPLVVKDYQTILINIQSSDYRPVRVEADGRTLDIDSSGEIVVKKSSKSIKLLRSKDFDFHRHFAEKMINKDK